ncbi:MAG TPA: hypothetical protein DCY07_03585 [Rhodospirillaceae bacterium]|nr:hypothetical protein [Rhodospirillaceae bacterium]
MDERQELGLGTTQVGADHVRTNRDYTELHRQLLAMQKPIKKYIENNLDDLVNHLTSSEQARLDKLRAEKKANQAVQAAAKAAAEQFAQKATTPSRKLRSADNTLVLSRTSDPHKFVGLTKKGHMLEVNLTPTQKALFKKLNPQCKL